MAIRPFNSINFYKNQASILLRDARSKNAIKRSQAILRLSQLRTLSSIHPNAIKRKHALAVVATEAGFNSWNELKQCFERPQINFGDFFGAPRFNGFLNSWFNSYASAKEYQRENSGYLFPFKNQYFVAEEGFIQSLGLESDDPNWQAIGFDWVKPKSDEALLSLKNKLQKRHCE